MKKHFLLAGLSLLSLSNAKATVHTIGAWDGYFQFVPNTLSIQLGDTVQWLPYFTPPTMLHTITSTSIPAGAAAFDESFQPPADTFYQYVPQVAGTYDYECTPHSTGSFNMVGSFTVTGSLSAPNTTEKSQLSIYPNPSTDFLILNQAGENRAYRILDSKGRETGTGNTHSRIDIRNLAAGLYYLHLIGNRNRYLQFIKE